MSPADTPTIARVAFNVRVYSLFDYTLPADAPPDVLGVRVLAPLGTQNKVGIIMETASESCIARDKLKSIGKVYDDMPPLSAQTRALIQFCSDYYHSPIGIAAAAALPAFFRRANEYHLPPEKKATGNTTAAAAVTVATAAPPLTAEQQIFTQQLNLHSGFAPHLLFGKTGSGKTEVYLYAVAQMLQLHKQVLFLTPEIHLTPQLENIFKNRFAAHRYGVLHSALPDGKRAREWLLAATGKTDIIIGTRLSVFTPMPRLGLIIIDEEHDESYKQEELPPFSARNLAQWRAKAADIPYIAGSATPSLESYHRHHGKQRLVMNRRVLAERAPTFEFMIEKAETDYHGLQSDFVTKLTDTVANGGQAMVFINRRGYARALVCRQCQQAHPCRRCSANMTVHRQRHILACHLCGNTVTLPSQCAQCGGALLPLGTGTQRVEEALAQLFPDVAQCRLDSDSATGKHFAQAQADILSGKTKIIIGTQIIAKGHNFPHLSLIGILNADAGLHAIDFRAEERLFAILSQVIGRGTRNTAGCHVVIQTQFPKHPFYQALAADDVDQCWQRLLDERQRAGLPPFAHIALFRARGTNKTQVEKFMQQSAVIGKQLAGKTVRVFDPVAPAIEKVSHQHRRHILIHSRHRRALHQFLGQWRTRLPKTTLHHAIDVDPLT